MSQVYAFPQSRTDTQPVLEPQRILVATCGDDESLGALHVAAELARRDDATVRVITVFPPFTQRGPASELTPRTFADDDSRRAIANAVRRQLDGISGAEDWPVGTVNAAPVDGILAAAKQANATLVILGKGKHGAVDRLVGSETAISVARRAVVPVLAVPEHVQSLARHAAVATDFTRASVRAAELTANLLADDGRIGIVHASALVDRDAEPGSLSDVYTVGAEHKMKSLRDHLRRRSQRTAEFTLSSGAVVDSLLEYVEAEGCDLIGLGSHELTALDRFLFGSVRSRILRRADCSVLVAPEPEQSENPDVPRDFS